MSISTIATLGSAAVATMQASKKYEEEITEWKSNAECNNSDSD